MAGVKSKEDKLNTLSSFSLLSFIFSKWRDSWKSVRHADDQEVVYMASFG